METAGMAVDKTTIMFANKSFVTVPVVPPVRVARDDVIGYELSADMLTVTLTVNGRPAWSHTSDVPARAGLDYDTCAVAPS